MRRSTDAEDDPGDMKRVTSLRVFRRRRAVPVFCVEDWVEPRMIMGHLPYLEDQEAIEPDPNPMETRKENKNSSLEKTVWIMGAQICGIIA